jgi:hypothetical protein
MDKAARMAMAGTALAAWLWAAGALAGPEVGDPAPDFELEASDGNTYRLSDFVASRRWWWRGFPRRTPGAAPSSASRWPKTVI